MVLDNPLAHLRLYFLRSMMGREIFTYIQCQICIICLYIHISHFPPSNSVKLVVSLNVIKMQLFEKLKFFQDLITCR